MPEHTMEQTAAAAQRLARISEPAPHAPVRTPAPGWDAAGARVPGAPSAMLAIQRAAGNQAVMRMLDAQRPGHPLAGPSSAVQRLSDDALDDVVQRATAALHEPSDDAIRSAAAEGVRTPSTTLPHLDRIQASFGRHSIAHVQAHVGPEAARASRAMNALAYASGNHIVFGAPPDLRTAAHEAAHIVQQQAGVQLSGGIGRAGDPYERHADSVADAVVAGRSAAAVLGSADAASAQRAGTDFPGDSLGQRTVQRVISIVDYRGSMDTLSKVQDYVSALDKAVDRAYYYVMNVPSLGAYQTLDGHTEHWVELWTKKGGMLSAAFGYAVESLATLVYLPPPPTGMKIELQGPRSGTRPDVILKQGTNDVAWLDITSAQSAGHIWDKLLWKLVPIHVAEVTYPKMEPSLIKEDPDYKDGVDPAESEARIAEAKKLLEFRRAGWKELGEKFPDPPGGDPVLRDPERRRVVIYIIKNYFNVDSVDEGTATDVLYAMSVAPQTWGLQNNMSRARGESFLLQYHPDRPAENLVLPVPPKKKVDVDGEWLLMGRRSRKQRQLDVQDRMYTPY